MKHIDLPLLILIATWSVLAGAEEAPHWLKAYGDVYSESPREASRQWFADAKFGLFVHMNLASLCQNGKADYLEWSEGRASDRLLDYVGYSRLEYEQAANKDQLLYDKYLMDQFDADKICELAVRAEMKYITFTTLHLGRCFNFETSTSDFTSLNAPAGRDFAAELAKACERHGLGLFFYVPPEYVATPDPVQTAHNRKVLTELLTQYGPIAGIWFDGIGNFYKSPENYTETEATYDMIRQLQPHALISFKEGGLCDEDFITPEHYLLPFDYEFDTPERNQWFQTRKGRWAKNNAQRWQNCTQFKLREINTVMQECMGRDGVHVKSGWINDESARHLTAEAVYYWLTYARYTGSNLLMNIGPCADGSIHADDWKALTGVGDLIRSRGWPPIVNTVPAKPPHPVSR